MKSCLRQRPWLIIVGVKVLFIAWWIAFVIYASRHTPDDAPATSELHGRR
jgi:hypothetical protein